MRIKSSTTRVSTPNNLPKISRKTYYTKSEFHGFLAGGEISDFGDVSSAIKTQLDLLKQISRFDIGDYLIVTFYKDGKPTTIRGHLLGYKKPPNLVMGIQQEGHKRATTISINPYSYGDRNNFEVRSEGESESCIEFFNKKTSAVPLHILKDGSLSRHATR